MEISFCVRFADVVRFQARRVVRADGHDVVVGIDEVEAAYQRTRDGWQDAEIDALLQRKDVTPAELIAGWITETGVLRPPFPPAD